MNKRSKSAGKSTTASKRALRRGRMETGSEYEKTSYGNTSRQRSNSYGSSGSAGKTTSRSKDYNG